MPAQTRIIHYYVCLGAAGGKEWKVNMSFPKNLLWGASISAFQAEGAKTEDDKGLTVADKRCEEVKNRLHTADTSIASDFYHHYHEDIKLMKEMWLKEFPFLYLMG